jgi:hypothetical protein
MQNEPPNETQKPIYSWLKTNGETARSFEAFCIYRDMGPRRSLVAAWWQEKLEREGRSGVPCHTTNAPSAWKNWCAKFHWKKRAESYDEYLREEERIQNELEFAALKKAEISEKASLRKIRIRQLEEEQWQIAVELQELANAAMKHLKTKPDKCSVADLVRILTLVQDLKHKSLGISDISEMSAITTLATSDLLPEQMVDTFAEVWEGAANETRKKIGALFIPVQSQEA